MELYLFFFVFTDGTILINPKKKNNVPNIENKTQVRTTGKTGYYCSPKLDVVNTCQRNHNLVKIWKT